MSVGNVRSAFIFGSPVPQGSARAFTHGSRVVVTSDNKNLKKWCTFCALVLRKDIAAHEQYEGPVAVELQFYFDRPKSHLNGSGSLRKGYSAHHTVKPDLDKLVRAILDAGTDAKVWHDDAQVVRLTASKRYVGTDGDKNLAGVLVKVWKEGLE
jgi:crossover junction endodeoxyribonuclease RusA